MPAVQMNWLIQRLRKSALVLDRGSFTDGELLGAFIAQQDEAAFEAIVRRHERMVLGVCRRVLSHAQDAEDAFQATFLVLVRKARSVVPRDAVGNWLYGVAYRTALAARRVSLRRGGKEKQVKSMPDPQVATNDEWERLQPVLDKELNALPDKYRLPVILCDLEGRTRRAVARELKIPDGTLSNRLTAARRMLARGLSRHGVAFSGGAVAMMLSQKAASAGVPASLMEGTVKAGTLMLGGKIVGTIVSAKVVALTEGVVKAMFLTKLKTLIAVSVFLGFVALGIGRLTHGVAAANYGQIKEAPKSDVQKSSSNVSGTGSSKTDLQKLHGTWTLVEMQTRGKKLTGKDRTYDGVPLKSLKLVFDCQNVPKLRNIPRDQANDPNDRLGAVDVQFNDNRPLKGDFRLNETKNPKDITVAWFLLYWESIYQMEGDTLTICFNPQNCIRPDQFRTSADSDRVVFVFHRTKASQEPKEDKKQEPIIKPRDILGLSVAGVDDPKAREILASDRMVRPDGTISLDTFGSIHLANLTTEQAGAALEKHLDERVPKIKVRVTIVRTETEPVQGKDPLTKEKAASLVTVGPQVSGVLLVVGTEIKPGDKTPAKDLISIGDKKYRRLAIGDRVVKDRVVAVLDDKLARLDLQAAEAKSLVALADLAAAKALLEEAKARFDRNQILFTQKVISLEEFKASAAAKDNCLQQSIAKEQQVILAKVDVEKAKLVVEMHQLRSPVDGVVQAIDKTRGAVKTLESVVQIKISE